MLLFQWFLSLINIWKREFQNLPGEKIYCLKKKKEERKGKKRCVTFKHTAKALIQTHSKGSHPPGIHIIFFPSPLWPLGNWPVSIQEKKNTHPQTANMENLQAQSH